MRHKTALGGLLALLWASPAFAQQVTACGFPDLTAQEVVAATGLAGAYLGVCWVGRIMLRMMT